ncbi:MAG: hypothetical protein WCC84_05360 [Candidatus Cybelea sp.]
MSRLRIANRRALANSYKFSYTAGLSPSALVTGVAPAPAAAYGP